MCVYVCVCTCTVCMCVYVCVCVCVYVWVDMNGWVGEEGGMDAYLVNYDERKRTNNIPEYVCLSKALQ